jgi:exodeoxyribonuclease VII large subunit
MDNNVLTVTQLNSRIKLLIDCDPVLSEVCVRGELSNYKVYPSGHHYFTLKDADSSLRCVMFKGNASKLRFRPESGMSVTAFGRVSVYPRDGAYQLYVSDLIPEGAGDLQVAFEQLKAKLESEGLFDSGHKKPLPQFPDKIAVITSSAGAAVHDMIRILGARWPMSEVILLPVRVQGAEAPAEIAGAIKYASKYKVADVIITGRGGGSIEDLWAFNDERVARAIYASELPVISAVGHEPDVTISDYVADRRASTPSNAAEIAVPDCAEMLEYLDNLNIRSSQAMRKRLGELSGRLRDLQGRRVMR